MKHMLRVAVMTVFISGVLVATASAQQNTVVYEFYGDGLRFTAYADQAATLTVWQGPPVGSCSIPAGGGTCSLVFPDITGPAKDWDYSLVPESGAPLAFGGFRTSAISDATGLAVPASPGNLAWTVTDPSTAGTLAVNLNGTTVGSCSVPSGGGSCTAVFSMVPGSFEIIYSDSGGGTRNWSMTIQSTSTPSTTTPGSTSTTAPAGGTTSSLPPGVGIAPSPGGDPAESTEPPELVAGEHPVVAATWWSFVVEQFHAGLMVSCLPVLPSVMADACVLATDPVTQHGFLVSHGEWVGGNIRVLGLLARLEPALVLL